MKLISIYFTYSRWISSHRAKIVDLTKKKKSHIFHKQLKLTLIPSMIAMNYELINDLKIDKLIFLQSSIDR